MTDSSGSLARILQATQKRPDKGAARAPEKEFVILFSARTGSSHLVDLLQSARIGDPREWLNPAFLEGQARAFGATTFADYFQRMRSRHSPRGVFGHKMAIWFYEAFSREVRLEDHFDFNVPCVFLFREDIVAQAVSLRLANHRRIFHDVGGAADRSALPAVAYDASEIGHCAELLADEERRLREFAVQKSLAPRYLSYERLTAAEPAAVVAAVGRMIGATPDLQTMRSRHRKLGDADNAAQAEKFAAENAAFCAALDARRRWLAEALRSSPLLA